MPPIETGSIKIVGSIDVTNISAGLNTLKRGLDEAKTSAKGSFGDISRLGGALSGLAGPLAAIGGALVSTTLGIAALSPQVAPSIARMGVEFQRLSRIFGTELLPVFEDVAEAFTGFVDFMDSDGRPIITSIGGVISQVGKTASNLVTVLGLAIEAAKELANQTFGPGAAKTTTGIVGTVFGGDPDPSVPGSDVVSNLLSTILTPGIAGLAAGAAIGTFVFPGVGTAMGGFLGLAGGLAVGVGQVIGQYINAIGIDEAATNAAVNLNNFLEQASPKVVAMKYANYARNP